MDGRMIVNEPKLAIRSAIEGVGLLQLPLDYVAPELAAGRLSQFLTIGRRLPSQDTFSTIRAVGRADRR